MGLTFTNMRNTGVTWEENLRGNFTGQIYIGNAPDRDTRLVSTSIRSTAIFNSVTTPKSERLPDIVGREFRLLSVEV